MMPGRKRRRRCEGTRTAETVLLHRRSGTPRPSIHGAPRIGWFSVMVAGLLLGCQGFAHDEPSPESHDSLMARAQVQSGEPAVISPSAVTPARPSTGCRIKESHRRELRVDGLPAYVYAQALSVSRGRVLLAGYPNYLWFESQVSPGWSPATDSIFGVAVSFDGTVESVPAPLSGHLGYVHAISRPEGGWRVVFTEHAESIHETFSSAIIGLWSGVFDGTAWSELERLPMPEAYEIWSPERASLARTDDAVFFAVIVNPGRQVLLFERRDHRWTAERVALPSDRAIPEPITVGHLSLLPSRHGPMLLVQMQEATPDAVHSPIVLYEGSDGWRRTTLVANIDRSRSVTSQFAAARGPAGDVISWVAEDEVYAYWGHRADGQGGGFRGFTVDTSSTARTVGRISQIVGRLALLPDGTPVWVTQPRTVDRSGAFRFFAGMHGSVKRLGRLTHPRWDLQALEAVENELLVAAAEFRDDLGGGPEVTSLLLRVEVDCKASQ